MTKEILSVLSDLHSKSNVIQKELKMSPLQFVVVRVWTLNFSIIQFKIEFLASNQFDKKKRSIK